MISQKSSRLSKILTLLVGVCLVGSAFHIHQLHPDYSLQDHNIPQHLSTDKQDCVACMSLAQAIPPVYDTGDLVHHQAIEILLPVDQKGAVEFISERNNKSPPA